jgi:hypothetical protein
MIDRKTGATDSGRLAAGERVHCDVWSKGTVRTHCRSVRSGAITWSTRCAAVLDIRRLHEGQMPRSLQENGSKSSSPHVSQTARAKP